MSNQFRSLDRITIPTPCDAARDSMVGNDQIARNGWARTPLTQAGSLPGRVRADVLSAEMLIRDRCMLSSARLANQVFPGGNYGRRKYVQEPVLLVSAAAGR